MTEKETGNAQAGACVDVLPRCSQVEPRLTIKLTMTSSTTSFPGSLPVAVRRVGRKVKGPEKFVGGACLVVYS